MFQTSVFNQKVQEKETFIFLKFFINAMIRTLKYKIFLISLKLKLLLLLLLLF
jgi:hypothetical protein